MTSSVSQGNAPPQMASRPGGTAVSREQCEPATCLRAPGVTCQAYLDGALYHKKHKGEAFYKNMLAPGKVTVTKGTCDLRGTAKMEDEGANKSRPHTSRCTTGAKEHGSVQNG